MFGRVLNTPLIQILLILEAVIQNCSAKGVLNPIKDERFRGC